MRVFVFANGPFIEGDFTQAQSLSPQLIIGVDGGAAHCHKLGIVPDIILGDLDSIPREILTEYRTKQVTIKQYPTRKDAADLELALELAVEHGADSIDIFFALGGRWDMSFANILMAANTKFQEVDIQLFSGSTKVEILRGKRNYTLSGSKGQVFSLLPLHGSITKINMQGCEYPLVNADISFGSTLGLSNVFISSTVEISFYEGVLAVITSGLFPGE